MKKTLSLIVFACLFQLSNAHPIPDTSIQENKIIGGVPASINTHSYQAFIRTDEAFCSGAIIGSWYILTTAHGLYNMDDLIPASALEVKVGTTYAFEEDSGTVYQAAETFVHPLYDPATGSHDIGIIKLESPIIFDGVEVIQPATSSAGISVGASMNVAGWGWKSVASGELSEILLEIDIPIIELYQYQIIAGDATGTQAVCYGDSGSPAVIFVDDKPTIAGITCNMLSADCDSYGVFAKVSEYESWIYSAIENFDPYGDTTVCESITSSNYACNNLAGYSYQWQLSAPEAGTLASDSYNCQIDWDPDFTGAVSLSVRASDGGGYSDWYSISLTRLPETEFITSPEDMILEEHADTTLSVKVEGQNITFQWMKDNLAMEGETDSTLSLTDVGSANEGEYKIVASGTCSSIESDPFYIQVNMAATAICENTASPDRILTMGINPLETYTVSVYTMNGEVVYQKSQVHSKWDVDLSSLKQGVYIMQILSSSGQIKAMKFMSY